MAECRACGATVDGETFECPNCGYSPRTTLLRNGAMYAILTAFVLVVFTPVVVSVFGLPPVPTLTVAIVVCLVTGYYGMYLILIGDSATVVEDMEEYVGLLVD